MDWISFEVKADIQVIGVAPPGKSAAAEVNTVLGRELQKAVTEVVGKGVALSCKVNLKPEKKFTLGESLRYAGEIYFCVKGAAAFGLAVIANMLGSILADWVRGKANIILRSRQNYCRGFMTQVQPVVGESVLVEGAQRTPTTRTKSQKSRPAAKTPHSGSRKKA